jgi:hypothetical protein
MRVELDKPSNGWTRVAVTIDSQTIKVDGSYTPTDSVADLAHVVCKILKGCPEASVTWHDGPEQTDFCFTPAADGTRFSIIQFPRGVRTQHSEVRILDTIIPIHILGKAFWRALRRLESAIPAHEYARAWRHPFPTEKVAEATRLLHPEQSR